MKTIMIKGMLTVLVLFVALTLNATLGSIAVSGFITSDEGENLSKVTISCPTNSLVESTTSTTSGFYSISGLQHNDALSYTKDGYNSQTRTISSSSGLSQQIDVEMSSSSTN